MLETKARITQPIERPQEVEWKALSNCLGVDPDLFFPGQGESTREAKEVCRGCVVRFECLEFAIESNEPFGIWGGLGDLSRRKLRRWLVAHPGTSLSDALRACVPTWQNQGGADLLDSA